MGSVAVTLMVLPSSPDTDLSSIKARIAALHGVKEIKEIPVAFGLKALEVLVTLPDAAGGTDALEDTIRTIDGVESVATRDITLL